MTQNIKYYKNEYEISTRLCAEVVELVDTLGSGSSGGSPVQVQVLSSAPKKLKIKGICESGPLDLF